MPINMFVVRNLLGRYKALIATDRYNEIYKWREVKIFQENWNIDATDLKGMIERSLVATSNLWSSNRYYPRRMLLRFCEMNAELVRRAFRQLFDEAIPLNDRIASFTETYEGLVVDLNQPGVRNHYQDLRAIFGYLAFRYPEKYYLYKLGMVKHFAELVQSGDIPTAGGVDTYLKYRELAEVLKGAIKADAELIRAHRARLGQDCYQDPELNLLTQDVIYCATTYLSEEEAPAEEVQNTDPGRTTMQLPLNTILYGPPGTGKTWRLRNEYMKRFTEETALLGKEEFAVELVKDLPWWQVVAMVLIDLKTSTVSEILVHPLLQARLKQANIRTLRASIWKYLQMHTKMECSQVNVSRRSEPLLFMKDEQSIWSIDEPLAREEVPELFDILVRYHNYTPGQGIPVKRFEFTTFHQSYSYEDFVEGIKPVMSEEDPDTLRYEIKSGIFRTIVQRALADPHHDYALLIDEINRGNVANIFGELITLIEDDKRQGASNELRVLLPYSRDEFVVPKNLHIIGSMNTADRSVEALDTALRRRFTFIPVMPEPERIEQPNGLNVDLRRLLVTMNNRITVLLDKDRCIGHSYFMTIAGSGDPLAELRRTFLTRIVPLLGEYFYGDPAKIGMVLGERFVLRREGNSKWGKGEWGLDEFEERQVYDIQDPATMTEEEFRSIYE